MDAKGFAATETFLLGIGEDDADDGDDRLDWPWPREMDEEFEDDDLLRRAFRLAAIVVCLFVDQSRSLFQKKLFRNFGEKCIFNFCSLLGLGRCGFFSNGRLNTEVP